MILFFQCSQLSQTDCPQAPDGKLFEMNIKGKGTKSCSLEMVREVFKRSRLWLEIWNTLANIRIFSFKLTFLRMNWLIIPTFGLSLSFEFHWKEKLTGHLTKLCALCTHRFFSQDLNQHYFVHCALTVFFSSWDLNQHYFCTVHSPFESAFMRSSGELHHLLPVNHRLHGAFCHTAGRTGLQTLCWYHPHICWSKALLAPPRGVDKNLLAPPRGVNKNLLAPQGGVDKNLLAPPMNYY